MLKTFTLKLTKMFVKNIYVGILGVESKMFSLILKLM